MLRILESEIVCDGAYVGICGSQPAFGFCNDTECDYFLRRISSFPFYQVSEIPGREVGFLGKVRDTGHLSHGRSGGIDFRQLLLERRHNRGIHLVARYELAVIEPAQVFKKKLYVC